MSSDICELEKGEQIHFLYLKKNETSHKLNEGIFHFILYFLPSFGKVKML